MDSAFQVWPAERQRAERLRLWLRSPSGGLRRRLLGVSISGLTGASERGVQQLSFGDLDGGAEDRGGAASEALDAVRSRFGTGAVGPAALAGRDGVDVKREGDTQWGPRSGQPGSG